MNEIGIILSYGLYCDKNNRWISLEATKFNELKQPISWAIRRTGWALSKYTGKFEYEPMYSSRDEKFLKEFRFDSIEEAVEYWKNIKI